MRTLFTLLLAAICVVGYAQKKPKINQALTALEDGELAEAKSIIDAAIEHEKTNKKITQIPILLGGLSLIILSVLLTKEKFYHAAQFFEHSIQFGLPFVLIYALQENYKKDTLILTLKTLIAVTFFAHGLYAFGAYPVPGKFVDMVIQIFGFSESVTLTFLYIAGILDFVLAVLIFIPKIDKYALFYAVFWGLLTALARIAASFSFDFPAQTLHQNLYQVIYRLPHGLTPLMVINLLNGLNYFNAKKIQKSIA